MANLIVGLKFSDYDKSEVWRRWKVGETLSHIGRALNRAPPSIYQVLSKTGGVREPRVKRNERNLSLLEREEISRGLARNNSIRQIARNLKRSPSTISREIKRNGGGSSYRATIAEELAWKRAKRPKVCKLKSHTILRCIVASKLKRFWSPEQISGWLKLKYPNNKSLYVSPETIYKSLYIQTRGVLKKELLKHLRTKPRLRGARAKTTEKRGHIQDIISISERPASVEDRAIPGHWEGDLIEGSNKSYIATLVERKTRFVCLVKVESKSTNIVIEQLIKHAEKLPEHLYKSLTWDRGTELKGHKRFTKETGVDVYFCDPRSPWQRGTNENTNKLLRQYFPKRTDLGLHSQEKLDEVAKELNNRPRKTLEFATPEERYNKCVASTD
jgi:IS30 family transposase